MLNGRGLVLMELERYAEAAEAFDHAWALDRSDAVVLDNKGRALLMARDATGALGAFDEAIRMFPNNHLFHMDRGRALASLGHYEHALSSLEEALALDGKDIPAWKYKGNVLLRMGDRQRAADAYARAIDLGGTDASIYLSKGRAEEDLGRAEDALDSYVRAASLDPENAQLWMRIGVAQAKLGRYSDAVESLERSLMTDRTNNRAWLNRAAILEKIGKDEEALRCFDTVLGNEPHDKYAWSGKGRVLLRMDKLDQAKRAFDKALDIDPELASAVEGSAALGKKLKDREISLYAAKVLEYEYRQNRKVTREEAFKECGLPFASLDEVTAFLVAKEPVDVEALSEEKFHAYEELSHMVILATLGNPGYSRQGLHLADVYMNMPDRDVRRAKKIMAYIEQVNKMDFPDEVPDKTTERLLRAAMDLPQDAHSPIGVMEHLDVGLYTARRIVSILRSFSSEPAPEVRRGPAQASAPMADEEVEDLPEVSSPRPQAREGRTAPDEEPEAPSMSQREARPMFKKRRNEEEEATRSADRSKAILVRFNSEGAQYNGRKCLFHGEPAVAVCPNCGTLFCMECTGQMGSCPRCHTALDFVDTAKEPAPIDDRDVIETEEQRQAIAQRWAQKRLAEADRRKEKEREGSKGNEWDYLTERSTMTDKDAAVARLLRDTERRYNMSTAKLQDAPAPVYRAAVRKVEEEQAAAEAEAAMAALSQEAEVQEFTEPEAKVESVPDFVPEEIIVKGAPAEEGDEEKDEGYDEKRKLREILEREDDTASEPRDLSRL